MSTLDSGLPEHVGDEEYLARFLTQSNQYTATVVKPAAFLPSVKGRETSVSRHGREPEERLWSIGAEAAGARNLHGVAILKARAVRDAQLDVLAAEPPPYHAAIRGWPWIEADPALQKARQKALALQLVSSAGAPLLRNEVQRSPV
ncbi:MAG: hypothetical protein A3K19_29700 [Lentisphaerae bacterium RIFOXYB12_FULL_65_16]|nr:MAG: hypothetical protein A3K18_33310 [Lentisphaerae bacterium RIFOXYA12_64_32]OGV86503.1 MAG: hypothetical protein A3K19_29700 [Lentisphaerae bacterium RIFOXYB12_FULL_65_16]